VLRSGCALSPEHHRRHTDAIVAKIHRKRQTWLPVQDDAKCGAARLDDASRLRFLRSLREIVTAVLRGMD